ncbi:MAG: hypothetical protein ACTSQY_10700 [Candidatus Odinarchaeia archaeon]
MNIGDNLKTMTSMLNVKIEDKFNSDKLQNIIDTAWQIIDNSRGKVNDVLLNKLSEILTKISIVLDAYKANMIKFDNLKVYIEREQLINSLNEIHNAISS